MLRHVRHDKIEVAPPQPRSGNGRGRIAEKGAEALKEFLGRNGGCKFMLPSGNSDPPACFCCRSLGEESPCER